jgi:hypothetical protein
MHTPTIAVFLQIIAPVRQLAHDFGYRRELIVIEVG